MTLRTDAVIVLPRARKSENRYLQRDQRELNIERDQRDLNVDVVHPA